MQPATEIILDGETGEFHGVDGFVSEEDKANIRQYLALQELKEETARTKEAAANVMAIAEPAIANMLKRAERLKQMGYSLDVKGGLVRGGGMTLQ